MITKNARKLFTTATLMILMPFAIAHAIADVSVTTTLTTDYVWRGVSQTEDGAALQASLDYEHETGFYAGAWASNVSFEDDNETDIEVDYYAGYANDINDDLSYDINLNRYTYPGSSIDSSNELFVSATYKLFSMTVARDFENENNYYQFGFDTELDADIYFSARLGRYDLDEGIDYNDYMAALSKEFYGFDFELSVTDTNMSDSECLDFSGDEDLCDVRAILTISHVFE